MVWGEGNKGEILGSARQCRGSDFCTSGGPGGRNIVPLETAWPTWHTGDATEMILLVVGKHRDVPADFTDRETMMMLPVHDHPNGSILNTVWFWVNNRMLQPASFTIC